MISGFSGVGSVWDYVLGRGHSLMLRVFRRGRLSGQRIPPLVHESTTIALAYSPSSAGIHTWSYYSFQADDVRILQTE